MPYKKTMKLREASNVDFINAIRAEQSMSYQERIPPADQGNVREVLKNLQSNTPMWNSFMDSLVNRIGSVVARNMVWSNPLAQFKQGMMSFGDTIEEVQLGMIKAHSYDANRESMEIELFSTAPIPSQSSFHHTTREDVYPFTVNESQLQRAFLDEGGLSDFVNKMMSAPVTSDNWDEFLATCELISQYEAYTDGFYHVKVGDPFAADIDDAGREGIAKDILRKIRAFNSLLKFPSTLYNAAHMPTFAQPGEMIFITTPEVHSLIDVDALAAAFNTDRMDVENRIIDIPRDKFGLDTAVGLLTTKDFFVLADTKIENTSMYNPGNLSTKFFFHHWEILSASRFVPAILFDTVKDDQNVIVNPVPTAVTIGALLDDNGDEVTNITIGEYSQLSAEITTTPAGMPGIGLDWEMSGQNTKLKSRIDNNGIVYIDPKETATSVVVTATAVWIDPASGADGNKKVSKTFTVSLTQPTPPPAG